VQVVSEAGPWHHRPMRLPPSLVWLLLVSAGCARNEYRPPARSPVDPVPVATSQGYRERAGPRAETGVDALSSRTLQAEVRAVQQVGGLAGAPAVRAAGRLLGQMVSGGQGGAVAPRPPAAEPISAAGKATGEMLDIEAHVTVQVPRVNEALPALRALIEAHGARVINDVVTDQAQSAGAALSIRVPVEKTEAFLASLAGLGRVASRRVVSRDIGKEFHDAQLLLKNLEAALARYQEILARAQSAAEILEVEVAMNETRARIDRVKGDLLWMKDHAERSTVYVTLEGQGPGEVPVEPKFFPGVRGAVLVDVSSRGDASTLAGGGLSVQLARYLNASMDLLKKTSGGGGGLDAFVLTLGSEFYSELLGGGRRRTLNPYLGLRAGYARFLGVSEVAAGGSLGVELYKSRALQLDLSAQALALFGSSRGSHAALVPALGLGFAF